MEDRRFGIELDVRVTLGGTVLVSEPMMATAPDLVFDLFARKLTHQIEGAMRDEIARSMGAKTVSAADLQELEQLLEEGSRGDFSEILRALNQAWVKVRRLCASAKREVEQ